MKFIVSPNPNDKTQSVMALLPVDIVYYNILTKLPAKSLLRFKSVCKDWYNLINSSNFRNIQHTHTLELESHDSCDFLVVSDTRGFSSSDDTTGTIWRWPVFYTYLGAPKYTSGIHRQMEAFEADCQIVGSSNGLICLKLVGSGFLLCNPVTREYSRLIKSPSLASAVVFSDVFPGFGYDVVSRDYKVVKIDQSQDCTVYVYSTGSQSWKESQKYSDLLHKCRSSEKKNVILNNKLHWIILKDDPIIDTIKSILMFDLHTEELGEISFPTWLHHNGLLDLRVSRGRLCALGKTRSPKCWNISMWVMKEYGVVESWTKLYEIEGKQICMKHYWFMTHLSRKNREEVLLLRYDNLRKRELVWYNLENKSITAKAKNTEPEKNSGDDWLCIASLAPIPGNDPNKCHTDLAILDDIKKEVAFGYSSYLANLPMQPHNVDYIILIEPMA